MTVSYWWDEGGNYVEPTENGPGDDGVCSLHIGLWRVNKKTRKGSNNKEDKS